MNVVCRCGEIGRHEGLKIPFWKQSTGSTPVGGIKKPSSLSLKVFLIAPDRGRTARPPTGSKQQPSGLLLSARVLPSRNVYRGYCTLGSDLMIFLIAPNKRQTARLSADGMSVVVDAFTFRRNVFYCFYTIPPCSSAYILERQSATAGVILT